MFRKLIKSIWNYFHKRYAIRQNVSTGRNLHIGMGSIVWAPTEMRIGDDVYIGKGCTIECDGSIGDNVMIANSVGLVGRHDHDYTVVGRPLRKAPWIGEPGYKGRGKGLRVVVGDDVWIGFGAVVLSGVNVGRGAIVAAGSVVTRDVEPYSIFGGSPARKLGVRFTDEQIRDHEALIYGGGR